MPKERVCANTPALPRRMVLTGLPLAGASVALATISTADEPSPLRSLYFRWQALKSEFYLLPPDCDADSEDQLFNRMLLLEQQAADFEPQTMEDLAFKILFADDNGEMDNNIFQKELVERAYIMAGIVSDEAPHQLASLNTSVKSETTPIQTLYHIWRELTEHAESQANTVSEDEFDAMCDRLRSLEDQIVALPSLNHTDALAKMIVVTVNDFSDGAMPSAIARKDAMAAMA